MAIGPAKYSRRRGDVGTKPEEASRSRQLAAQRRQRVAMTRAIRTPTPPTRRVLSQARTRSQTKDRGRRGERSNARSQPHAGPPPTARATTRCAVQGARPYAASASTQRPRRERRRRRAVKSSFHRGAVDGVRVFAKCTRTRAERFPPRPHHDARQSDGTTIPRRQDAPR